MSIYCYDTEFLDNGKTIELISIGIVCEDGREYYAVNSDMDTDRIAKSSWLMENVWPHLPLRGRRESTGYVGSFSAGVLDTSSSLLKPKWVIANEVRDFLLAEPDPKLWAYYGAYDHVALAQLWGSMVNLPKGIPMWTRDLMQLIESLEDFAIPPQIDEHNALADARWNYQVLCAAQAEIARQR